EYTLANVLCRQPPEHHRYEHGRDIVGLEDVSYSGFRGPSRRYGSNARERRCNTQSAAGTQIVHYRGGYCDRVAECSLDICHCKYVRFVSHLKPLDQVGDKAILDWIHAPDNFRLVSRSNRLLGQVKAA